MSLKFHGTMILELTALYYTLNFELFSIVLFFGTVYNHIHYNVMRRDQLILKQNYNPSQSQMVIVHDSARILQKLSISQDLAE